MKEIADICIICEGSYPHYVGGVAEWVHELIQAQPNRTFEILSLVPPNPDLTMRYPLPPNVIGHTVQIVLDLPRGKRFALPELWVLLERMLTDLVRSKTFEEFDPILRFFNQHQDVLGKQILLESTEAWDLMLRLYETLMPSGPFKAFFATMYTLSRSLYSLLMAKLPQARLYHAVCTGYAGFMIYRAKHERGAPCILTEHAIYSNERRIEIAMADWVAEMQSLDLAIEDKKQTLKTFWLNAFNSFAHVCYTSCDEVISTFGGNQPIQRAGGAVPDRMRVIPHGIDLKKYESVYRTRKKVTNIAFIGRIVPIKDIKTFIRACQLVHTQIPDARFFIAGPTDQDPVYFEECKQLVALLNLSDVLQFTGRVDVIQFFSKIDLLVLTSISEAQPLVMLEAGAAGIPTVATDVGACREIGGVITPLADHQATADAIIRLIQDPELYQKYSQTIQEQIRAHYRADQEYEQYHQIYENCLKLYQS